MADLPPSFLSGPNPATTITHINFEETGVPEYAGLYAVLLENVLTPEECQTLVYAAEAQTSGKWERAMINVGMGEQKLIDDARRCGRIIWDSHDVAARLWSRVKEHIPDIERLKNQPKITGSGPSKRNETWRLTRLNERLRFLKYEGGEYFRVHSDGCYQTPDGKERSYYTLHLYLNDAVLPDEVVETTLGDGSAGAGLQTGLRGGATTFHSDNMKRQYDVVPKAGRVLVFQHRDLWHSGDDVVSGVKYTLRTDIMYEKEEEERGG